MSTSEDETHREDDKSSPESDINTGITSRQTMENVEESPSRSSNPIDESSESSVQVRNKSEVKQLRKAKNIEAEKEIAEHETEIVEQRMEIVERHSLDRVSSDSDINLPSPTENDQEINEGVSFCQISEDNCQLKSFEIEIMNPSTADSEAVLKRKMVTKSPKAGETHQKRTRETESEEDSDYATTVPDTIESRPPQNIPYILIEEDGIPTSSTKLEFTCNVECKLQPCSDSDASPEDDKQRLVESDSDNDEKPSTSGVVKTELFVPEVDPRNISQVEAVINPYMSNSSTNTSLRSFDENRDSGIQSSSMSTLDMFEGEMDDSTISNVDTVSTSLSTPELSSGVQSGESVHSSVSEMNDSRSNKMEAVNPTENAKISEENTAEADSSSCRQKVQEDILENKNTDQYDICTQQDESSLPEKQQENDVEVASAMSGGLETMSALDPRDASPCDDSNMSVSMYSEHSSEYDHSSSTTASNTDETPAQSQHVKKGKTALSPLYAYTKGKKDVGKGSPAQQMEGTSAVQAPDVEVEEVESTPNLVISADSTDSTNRAEGKPQSSANNEDDGVGEVQNECFSLYSGNERAQELSPRDRYYKHWKRFADKQWNKGEIFNEAFATAIRNFETQHAERASRNEPTGAMDGVQDLDIEEGASSVASNSAMDVSEAAGGAAAEDARMDLSDSGPSPVGDCTSPPRDARLLQLFLKMDELKGAREEIPEDFDPYAQLSEILSDPDDNPFRSRDLAKMGLMLDTFLSSRERESSSSEEGSADRD